MRRMDPYGLDIYDRQGNPITHEEWGVLRENERYRVVALTQAAGIEVSTVWLGLNHNFSSAGAPIIFESMIFSSRDDGSDGVCERYYTEEAALAGHDQLVAEWIGHPSAGLATAMGVIDPFAD